MPPKKSLGQHFLKCGWVISTLIKAADLKSDDTVLEIGPGTGILTRALAKRVQRVIAVEKDEKLAEGLALRFWNEKINNVEIIAGDILVIPVPILDRYKVVANIPYYLTARLLRILLERGPKPEIIALTVQKEVAQRLVTRPPKMNLLALSVRVFGKTEIVKVVPASCFWPKPKVDSAIIKISHISDGFFIKNAIDKDFFFKIVRRAFSQKRKMLSSSLRSYFGQLPVLTKTGLSERARPQELDLEQWAKLVRELSTETKKPE